MGFGWVEVVVIGVTSGTDAGSAVKGVYFQAGVVRDDDFAGGAVRVVDSFEASVAFEGGLVFRGGGDFFYAREWG
jgi:hypothetical protein